MPGRPSRSSLPADDRRRSQLLQRVRDEAHRFAITFHRQRRGRDRDSRRLLDELPGVGPARKRRILEHFGRPERFSAASREELERCPACRGKVAREIYAPPAQDRLRQQAPRSRRRD